jgi:hypothetical protein
MKTELAQRRCGARDGGRFRRWFERSLLGTASVRCFEVGWSGGVRHLIFIARGCAKQGRNGFGREDSIGETGKEIRLASWRRRRRRLTRGAATLVTHREGYRGSARTGPSTGLGPRRNAGTPTRGDGPRAQEQVTTARVGCG